MKTGQRTLQIFNETYTYFLQSLSSKVWWCYIVATLLNVAATVVLGYFFGTSMTKPAAGSITILVVTLLLSIFGQVSLRHLLRRSPPLFYRACQRIAKTSIIPFLILYVYCYTDTMNDFIEPRIIMTIIKGLVGCLQCGLEDWLDHLIRCRDFDAGRRCCSHELEHTD